MGLTLGTSDKQTQLKPSADICINSKLEWVKLDSAIEKHPKGPFDERKNIETNRRHL